MLPVAVILLMCEPILSKLNCNVNAYIRMYHHESQHAVATTCQATLNSRSLTDYYIGHAVPLAYDFGVFYEYNY